MTDAPATSPALALHAASATPASRGPAGLPSLAIGALGVVFGDIGTSPLYALKECVSPQHGVPPTPANVLGLLSLIVWSLTLVVSIKYVRFVMRADNHGEGGILALLALVPDPLRSRGRSGLGALAALVLFGAALLYGDGVITPAISVLSAVEGLRVAEPRLGRFVVPLTCGVLLGLFAVQRRGTGRIGRVFGAVMLAWFVVIAVLGARALAREPGVLRAVWPGHALAFLAHHGRASFVVLGSVVLAVTGGEALYADMGHFGARPIRVAWHAVVLPALVLNYFGQGALLLLHHAGARDNPFFALVPPGLFTYGLVALAASATVIASQALISGAFSLTRQAVQLGYLPHLTVRHTSARAEGQIYIGAVNWLLAAACLGLVLAFRQSSRLAAAYGIAVTGTMAITSLVFYVVARTRWRWPRYKALPLLALFWGVDLTFVAANLLKFVDGGYVPILVATAVFAVMLVWRRGRSVLLRRLNTMALDPVQFTAALARAPQVPRVPGTGIFLTANARRVPAVLVHYMRHVHALPARVVLLNVRFERAARVPAAGSVEVEALGAGVYCVVAHAGFMDKLSLPDRLREAEASAGLELDGEDVTYFLGRETFLATRTGEMGRLTEAAFGLLYKLSGSIPSYLGLPPERVMDVGMYIDL